MALIPLRQSTVVTKRIGPFIGLLDGYTPKTVLNLTNLKANTKISKADGAEAALHDTNAFTEDARGFYFAEFDATDTATLGRLTLFSSDVSNYLPMWIEFQVYPQSVYDALFAGSGSGILANIATILGTASAGAAGYVAPDWAHINAPTTTVDLSGTTIKNVDNAAPATLAASQPNYAPAKAGDAMTLTAAYDAAKTAAQAGNQMDLINAPNATAITAIQLGLSKPGTAQTINQTTALPVSPTAGTIGEALAKADTLHFTGSVGQEKVNSQVADIDTAAQTEIANAVLDAPAASHNTAGTIGALINLITSASGSAAAFWNYLVSSAGTDITKMGGLIVTLYNLVLGINSRTLTTPVNINSSDTNVLLNITQTVTYSAANGNQKQVNVAVSADPTLATVSWVFLYGSTAHTYTGEVISYDSSTGIAVVAMADFTATKALFPSPSPQQLTEQRFTVSIELPASAGVLVPIGYHLGRALIQAAGTPSP